MIRVLYFLVCFFSLCSNAVDFNKDIKPILSKKCFSCHGKSEQKGKLRLDIREYALKKKAIVPGNPKDSEIVKKIFSTESDDVMPPPEKGTLKTEEKELLKKWIEEGANYDSHWAYNQLAKIPLPKIKSEWISNPIDSYVLNKLTLRKLKQKKVPINLH